MVKKRHNKIKDEDAVDPTSRHFIYDEVDDFNNIDKEEEEDDDLEYSRVTKLIDVNKRKEQVLGLDLSSEDESEFDGDSDELKIDEDDIQSSGNDSDVPEEDERTMGKRKKDYFGTDITDTRLHNIGRLTKKKKKKEDESLQVELDLAQKTQKRIGRAIESVAFLMDDEVLAFEKSAKGSTQEIKSDTKQEKLSKESRKKTKKTKKDLQLEPEIQEKCDELTSLLAPLIDAHKKGLLPPGPVVEYLTTRYFLCLNYLNNEAAKRMLVCSGDDISVHSTETRLAQLRQMYKELDECKSKFNPELNQLLEDLSSGKLQKKKRKMLGIIKGKNKSDEKPVDSTTEEVEREDMDVDEDKEMMKDEELQEAENDAESRRLISYEIAKNKGLLPARKKEQRNPRVKYKQKYLKKLKRRKGQVRTVRHEIKKYGGEVSGIKANVVKSIKLK